MKSKKTVIISALFMLYGSYASAQIMPWENRTETDNDPFAKSEMKKTSGMLHLEDVLVDAHCHTQLSPRLWGLLCLHCPRLRQFQKLLNDISHCLRILLTRD